MNRERPRAEETRHHQWGWQALLCLSVLGLNACKPSQTQGAAPFPPPVVLLQSPHEKMVSEWDQFTGRVDAVESVEIRPRVSGHLSQVRFHAGQMVTKDEVLFEIDPRWQEASVSAAKANVAQAQAKLLTATQEAKRADGLEKARAISAEEAESRRGNLASAEASLHAAQAALRSAELDLEFTKIRTPISGRVSRAILTQGNHVSGVPGFTTLLTSVVSIDPVYVYAAVDESSFQKYLRLISQGKLADFRVKKVEAEVALDGDEGFPHKGVIESFDNKLDATTGSITLRLLVPNPKGALTPGSFARVRLPGSESYKALLVDEKVIRTDQSLKFVFLAGEGRDGQKIAEVRPLQLGPLIDGKRVVREGLRPSDQIISSNLHAVMPGGPITPAPAGPPSGGLGH